MVIGAEPYQSRVLAPLPIINDQIELSNPDQTRIARARQLTEFGLRDQAALELQSLAVLDPKKSSDRAKLSSSTLLHLIRELSASGLYLTSFTLIDPILQRSDESLYHRPIVELIYPTDQFTTISSQGEKNGLDPLFVLSLMKQESGFEGQILSRVGAEGLMQLMPYTGREVYGKVFGSPSAVERRDFLQPELNVTLGTAYLKQLSERYNGNGAMMLAAYNAGPARMDSWKKSGIAERGFLEFVEQIPFSETRGYVARIFRNYVYYKALRENVLVQIPDDRSSERKHPFWNR
ncbi:MAG: lytic transglycosylase domain-containing protein [Proteobacteria bacterium]|nr:MAG: lytic transglycosylase domain-containing protein [Pseudomonadota bacterium]